MMHYSRVSFDWRTYLQVATPRLVRTNYKFVLRTLSITKECSGRYIITTLNHLWWTFIFQQQSLEKTNHIRFALPFSSNTKSDSPSNMQHDHASLWTRWPNQHDMAHRTEIDLNIHWIVCIPDKMMNPYICQTVDWKLHERLLLMNQWVMIDLLIHRSQHLGWWEQFTNLSYGHFPCPKSVRRVCHHNIKPLLLNLHNFLAAVTAKAKSRLICTLSFTQRFRRFRAQVENIHD